MYKDSEIGGYHISDEEAELLNFVVSHSGTLGYDFNKLAKQYQTEIDNHEYFPGGTAERYVQLQVAECRAIAQVFMTWPCGWDDIINKADNLINKSLHFNFNE